MNVMNHWPKLLLTVLQFFLEEPQLRWRQRVEARRRLRHEGVVIRILRQLLLGSPE